MSAVDPPRFVKWQKIDAPTEQEAEAQLQQEGYEPFLWTDVPGSKYPRHKHQIDECIWLLKGEITFFVDEAEYSLRPGDRLYLPSHIHHQATVPENASATYLVGQRRS